MCPLTFLPHMHHGMYAHILFLTLRNTHTHTHTHTHLVLASIYITLTQARVTQEEGASTERMSP